MTTKTMPTAAQRRTIAAREAHTRKVMRIVAITAAVPVGLIALYASYFHITALAILNGQSQSLGHLTAVPIDGLMLVAGVAMIAERRARLPRIAFAVGAVFTVAANVISVHPFASLPVALALAGVPAVALLLTAEMLFRLCLPAVPQRRKPAARKVAQPVTKTVKTPARIRVAVARTDVATA